MSSWPPHAVFESLTPTSLLLKTICPRDNPPQQVLESCCDLNLVGIVLSACLRQLAVNIYIDFFHSIFYFLALFTLTSFYSYEKYLQASEVQYK